MTKFSQISVFSCIAIFIALVFISWARYFRMREHVYYIEWDCATTTAGDYTLMMKVDPSMFKQWKQSYDQSKLDNSDGLNEHESVGLAFKTYLKTKIESQLVQYDGGEDVTAEKLRTQM